MPCSFSFEKDVNSLNEKNSDNSEDSGKHLISVVYSKKTVACLASYVKNGRMTPSGVKIACSVLNSYKKIVKKYDPDFVYIFATASLRNISNRNSVLKTIQKSIDAHIEILSGEEEARLCYLGAAGFVDIPDGILVDIGGGSTEIVTFENKQITDAFSIPVGSLNLLSGAPKRAYISLDELRRIRKTVRKELEKAGGIKYRALIKNNNKVETDGVKTIIGVGGSLRAVGKLHLFMNSKYPRHHLFISSKKTNTIKKEGVQKKENMRKKTELKKNVCDKSFVFSGCPYPQSLFSTGVPSDFIKRLVEHIVSKDKKTYISLKKTSPERMKTFPYGLIILSCIIDETGSERMVLSPTGIREGFLVSKLSD